MDIRKIKKLIEMLEESQLNEIEISEGEESIRLSRGSTPPIRAPLKSGYEDERLGAEIDHGGRFFGSRIETHYRNP